MEVFINLLLVLGAIIYIAFTNNQVEAKKSKSQTLVKCQLDECLLSQQHYTLYSFIKRTVDNEFDLNGREILPFLKSVEVLKRRFSNQGELPKLNGTELVQRLLSDENLVKALKVFNSEEGKALINFYRASVNGKSQNLACSQSRVEDFEIATSKFEANKQLASIFSNIHKNYLKKSAKKCLKHSCTSIETSMIKLDSVLGKYQSSFDDLNLIGSGEIQDQMQDKNQTFVPRRREFETEELELCRFFRKTNESDCEISGRELSDISFSRLNKTDMNPLREHLTAYNLNKKGGSLSESEQQQGKDLDEAARSILAQCRPISSLLDYNLVAIKWYRKQNLFDDQKFNSRTFWCPSLSYWLQLDRLCGELEKSLDNSNTSETFSYV